MRSRYLTDNEIAALRSKMSATEWLPVRVCLETGLRIGDVVKIRPADLVGGFLLYDAQKTKKSGKIKLKNALYNTLVHSGLGEMWVFPSPMNSIKHLTRQAVWARVKRAAYRAGIDMRGVSPHSLRKVFAVKLYTEKGLKAAQAALQHSNIATTELYTLADWTSGEYANRPLLRADIPILVQKVVEVVLSHLDKS